MIRFFYPLLAVSTSIKLSQLGDGKTEVDFFPFKQGRSPSCDAPAMTCRLLDLATETFVAATLYILFLLAARRAATAAPSAQSITMPVPFSLCALYTRMAAQTHSSCSRSSWWGICSQMNELRIDGGKVHRERKKIPGLVNDRFPIAFVVSKDWRQHKQKPKGHHRERVLRSYPKR